MQWILLPVISKLKIKGKSTKKKKGGGKGKRKENIRGESKGMEEGRERNLREKMPPCLFLSMTST